MKIKIFGLIIVFLLLGNTSVNFALETDKFNVGIYSGLNINNHLAGFVTMPTYTNQNSAGNTGTYNNTSTLGLNFGFLSEYYFNSTFGFGLNLGYSNMNANLTYRENNIGLVEIAGKPYQVDVIHNLDTKLGLISLKPSLLIKPFRKIPLTFNVGVNYGIFLVRTFSQYETLADGIVKENFNFTNLVTTDSIRNQGSGKIPFSFDYMAVSLGAKYNIFTNDKYRLGIEAGYINNIKEIVKNTGWKVNQMSVGLSFAYNISKQTIEDEIPVETKSIDKPRETKKDTVIATIKPPVIEQSKPAKKDTVLTKPKEEIAIEPPKQEEQVIQGVDLLKDFANWKCCYIILYSSDNKKNSEKILNDASSKEVNDLSIASWYDKEDRVTYYRVRTKCISSQEEVIKYKEKILNYLSQTKNKISPVIKCE